MVKGVFFSKNKSTARSRAEFLARTEGKCIVMKPRLARRQIPHISGWKTFEYSWKNKKGRK
jgi:hypothetical protein